MQDQPGDDDCADDATTAYQPAAATAHLAHGSVDAWCQSPRLDSHSQPRNINSPSLQQADGVLDAALQPPPEDSLNAAQVGPFGKQAWELWRVGCMDGARPQQAGTAYDAAPSTGLPQCGHLAQSTAHKACQCIRACISGGLALGINIRLAAAVQGPCECTAWHRFRLGRGLQAHIIACN